MEEGGVEIIAALEADEQAAVAMQPGKIPLDHPAVSAEFGLGLDALAGDAGGDAARSERSDKRIITGADGSPSV